MYMISGIAFCFFIRYNEREREREGGREREREREGGRGRERECVYKLQL